ncbi:hypothetical protein Tco_0620391 [Tanacetum coccineum]
MSTRVLRIIHEIMPEYSSDTYVFTMKMEILLEPASNKLLVDYEEIDGGFVAFGGNSKGGKITRKGKIRTGKLDFEDVYFEKELKFNLFSVSQMCDKKNSVLFTDTKCVVLSPDFKLTDESHVWLKVPRKDNMYSDDLKNVVPQGGLTCLFAKATSDESNLWHRRLRHVQRIENKAKTVQNEVGSTRHMSVRGTRWQAKVSVRGTSLLFLEMVTNTIDTVTSIPTEKELDLFCSTYNIPADLRPELPGPNDTIKDSLKGKIGIYTCFIEFANFRIPLSKFLLYVLQYYQINFSELSVLAATNISHFEIMCRVLGHPPSLGTFRRFYCNSISNCWLSFSKRSPSPCCFLKNLDSLKNWIDRFFWIDASVFPIFVSWYNDVLVKRGLLTSDDVVDLPLIDKLNHNCTLIRRCSEVFLCIVGLSYSFVDTDIHHTLLSRDKNDMGLLDFVKSSDPFKVKVRERTLAEGEVPLLTETVDMVVASSAQTVRLVSHTIVDELKERTGKKKRKVSFSAGLSPVKKFRSGGIIISEPNPTTASKTPAAMKRLITQSGQHDIGYESVVPYTEEFVSSSVTLTPERDCQDEYVSAHDENVRTRPASYSFIVLTSSSEHADTDTLTSPQVDSPTLHVQSETEDVAIGLVNEARGSYTIDFATAHEIYVPNWDVTNDARMDDLIMCRNLIVHVPPPGYWASLRNQYDAEFIDRLNVNAAQHTSEVAPAAKAEEFAGLTVQNVELLGQVSGLESVRDSLKERVAQLESDYVKIQRLAEHSSDLDARLSELSYLLDSKPYLHMLTVVAGRRWVIGHGLRLAFMRCCQSLDYHNSLAKVISLAIDQGIQQGLEAGIKHGKAGRELSPMLAYDPEVKARYEEVVGELENILLPFLDRMKSYKDDPLECIMASLYLEGGSRVPGTICHEVLLEEALEASYARAQKYKKDASSSLVVSELIASGPHDSSLVLVVEKRGTSSSLAATVTPLNSLVVTDYLISYVSMVKNVTDSEFQNLSSTHDQQMSWHDDMFDTTLLDKLTDHQLSELGSS